MVILKSRIGRATTPAVSGATYSHRGASTYELSRHLCSLAVWFTEHTMQDSHGRVSPLLHLGVVAAKRPDTVNIGDLRP